LKSLTFEELVEDDQSIKNLDGLKPKRAEFHRRNILPIPHFLTKAYLTLDKFDPQSVAQAFFAALKDFELKSVGSNPQVHSAATEPNLQEEDFQGDLDDPKDAPGDDTLSPSANDPQEEAPPSSCISVFLHLLQFCHLCFLKKIPPVLYSVTSTPEIDRWFVSVSTLVLHSKQSRPKCLVSATLADSELDASIASPECWRHMGYGPQSKVPMARAR
jgi:hypothetical protein